MTARGTYILHVDMDAFYAAVEQRDRPELRGLPLVVGGGGNRGVVAAASYEARKFGIRSAMPMRDAERRCPELVRVPVRMAHYKAVSEQVFAIFREYTPLVEGLSLDEAYLDVSASLALFGDARAIARSIKQRIAQETGLTASVGVAANKLVAKIASDLDKPDGLVVVPEAEVREVLDPLPVTTIPGVGRETLERLRAASIERVRDLRLAPAGVLESLFGRYAERMRQRAAGIDDRAVVPERVEKSISSEETWETDIDDAATLHRHLLRLTERTAARLRRRGLVAGTVQLKIRRSDFRTYTRRAALRPPDDSTARLYENAKKLLTAWRREQPRAKLRLLGVGGSDLSPAAQPNLFAQEQPARDAGIDRTVDAIRSRFGELAVGRARVLDPRRIR